jgi:hypothetical protein
MLWLIEHQHVFTGIIFVFTSSRVVVIAWEVFILKIRTEYGTVTKEIISMNEVEWNKRALREVKGFPEEVKKELGYLIFKLQIGEKLEMPHSR